MKYKGKGRKENKGEGEGYLAREEKELKEVYFNCGKGEKVLHRR